MTAKTMAELIDSHQWSDLEGGCLCGFRGEYDAYLDHAVGEFSAAGFGLVGDAQREAWDEGCSFGSLYDHTFRNDNPYRTEASS